MREGWGGGSASELAAERVGCCAASRASLCLGSVYVCVAEWESVSARHWSSVLCLSQQREPAATAAAYITISDVAP